MTDLQARRLSGHLLQLSLQDLLVVPQPGQHLGVPTVVDFCKVVIAIRRGTICHTLLLVACAPGVASLQNKGGADAYEVHHSTL